MANDKEKIDDLLNIVVQQKRELDNLYWRIGDIYKLMKYKDNEINALKLEIESMKKD